MNKGIAVAGTVLLDKINEISKYPNSGELTQILSLNKAVGGLVPNVGVDIKIMDENINRFRISVNASDMGTKAITIPSSAIKIKNDRDDFNVHLNSNKDITVTLVGPQADINAVTADNIRIEVDTADKTIVNDTKVLQGKVIISGEYNCWAIGKYDIKVSVKPQ